VKVPCRQNKELIMTTLRLLVPRLARCRPVLIAAMAAGSALLALPCAPSPAAAWGVGRALNPQPLPPGLYSPYHPGPAASQMRTPFNAHPSARRVCVAWGRVCVKAGQGTKTHPAPCEQYESVCEKYA
jgi:hypothetical protein